jgi:hypothetical protein
MTTGKWENRPVPANRPATRSLTRAARTRVQEITIDSNPATVNGAPLTLGFRKNFLRHAIPPLKHDFTFTAQDLSAFATNFWDGLH